MERKHRIGFKRNLLRFRISVLICLLVVNELGDRKGTGVSFFGIIRARGYCNDRVVERV